MIVVNHFLLTNEELIDRFKKVIEETVVVEDRYDEYRLYFNAHKNKEYWEIRKELLERMER
jgi:hypothetical protein